MRFGVRWRRMGLTTLRRTSLPRSGNGVMHRPVLQSTCRHHHPLPSPTASRTSARFSRTDLTLTPGLTLVCVCVCAVPLSLAPRALPVCSQRIAKTTALGVGAAFGTCLATTRDWHLTSEAMDLVHAITTTAMSVKAMAASHSAPPPSQLAWWPEGLNGSEEAHTKRALLQASPVLPSSEDHLVRGFLIQSSSYIVSDCVQLLASVVAGRAPPDWMGRLAHHALRFVANAPALGCKPPAGAIVRRYLMVAYAAVGASTALVRIRSILKYRRIGQSALHRLLARALLGTIFASLFTNLPISLNNVWRAKGSLPPAVSRLHLVCGALGMGLNAQWLRALLRD
jgi:hypothetical protein